MASATVTEGPAPLRRWMRLPKFLLAIPAWAWWVFFFLVPVALVGREVGRSWRIVVGAPVPYDADGGPLAAAELAEATRGAVQVLLDEALPTSWWF